MTSQLKPKIGKKTLFFLTINAILGTGIFFLPAIGASYAGPASLISWLVMSVVSIFIAAYFAELISMMPKSGGVYEYTKNAFGEFWSFIFGWTAWIVANITIAMLIVGSLYYLFPGQSTFFNIAFSLFFILLFNAISYRGIDVSAKMLLIFGVLTVITVITIIFPGLFHVNTSNMDPFFVFPFSSVFLATYFIAETFFGWETIGYLSEEVKDARKTIPKMLVKTTVVISILSFLLVFVALASTGWEAFSQQAAPLSFLSERFFGKDFASVFTVIVFIPLIGTAASWIVSSPRLLYAMARDNVLVPSFKQIHKKYKTPYKAIMFQTLFTSAITLIALGDFLLILSLLLPLAIIMYSGVMLSVVKLRMDQPRAKREFSAPFPKAGPVLITLFLFYLLFMWATEVQNAFAVLFFGLVFVFLGAPLYILIKLQTDERFTEKFFDRISFLWDKLFPLWYGKKDVSSVVNRLKINKNSVVLDFGCGSGITTAALSKKAKIVVGVDISEKQLEHAVKKIRSKGLQNVILVKEQQLKFKKNSFDAVSAVGVLEYLDKPEATMKRLFTTLKKGGRFSFLSFGKSMGTPAPYHLKDENAIRDLFRGIPVELRITKEKKKMTEYWHVWGRKK